MGISGTPCGLAGAFVGRAAKCEFCSVICVQASCFYRAQIIVLVEGHNGHMAARVFGRVVAVIAQVQHLAIW